jgi:Rps23 Pro-64 3,4-dihydroxylase Tpa1-like proline 4-hydroxylase
VIDLPSLIARLDRVQQAADARLWLTDAELDALLQAPPGTAAGAQDRLLWRNFVCHRQQFAGSGAFWTLTNQARPLVPAADEPYQPEPAYKAHPTEVTAIWRVVPDVLRADLADQLVAYAIGNEPAFRQASTTGGIDGYRNSLILPAFNEFKRVLENALLAHVGASVLAFNMPRLSPIYLETYLNAYPDGTFFKIHVDNDAAAVRGRLISFVYYFFREPQAFRGGELVMSHARRTADGYATRTAEVIVPRHNSVVFFPSYVPHEVRAVRVPSGAFADSRFALTGWVHAVESHAPV